MKNKPIGCQNLEHKDIQTCKNCGHNFNSKGCIEVRKTLKLILFW